MTHWRDQEVAERFLDHADETSFTSLFRVFSPKLIAFFRNRGHEMEIAEDLAQEVMLTVYRRAGQVRDRNLFCAWLFRIARNAAARHFARRMRELATVSLADVGDRLPDPSHNSAGESGFEFRHWMSLLEPHERETMILRFAEEWQYHEIAAAQGIPMGTIQWRVFNAKKKLATHLSPRRDAVRKTAERLS